MKACNVYKTKDYYKVVTWSQTVDGFWLSSEPVFLIPVTDAPGSLMTAVFESLKGSITGVPTPDREDYPVREKDLMKKLQEKNYAALYMNSSSCDVRMEKGTIEIHPEKYHNPKKTKEGLVWVEGDVVQIRDAENKKEEVISALIELLDRKYR